MRYSFALFILLSSCSSVQEKSEFEGRIFSESFSSDRIENELEGENKYIRLCRGKEAKKTIRILSRRFSYDLKTVGRDVFKLANCLYHAKRYRRAAYFYKLIAEKGVRPDYQMKSYSNLGVILYRFGNFEAAEAAFLKALKIKKHTGVYLNRFLNHDAIGQDPLPVIRPRLDKFDRSDSQVWLEILKGLIHSGKYQEILQETSLLENPSEEILILKMIAAIESDNAKEVESVLDLVDTKVFKNREFKLANKVYKDQRLVERIRKKSESDGEDD